MPDHHAWPGASARTGTAERELNLESARFWQAATARLAREINLGWWLAGWLPWAVATGLVGTFAMLFARWRGNSVAAVWAGIGVSLVAAAVVAWRWGRSRFESAASARVRLEEALGLKARLTAAQAGVGPWPDRPAQGAIDWPVRWRWRRPVAWMAVVATLLMVASRAPMADTQGHRTHLIEPPTDARVVEQWMEELRREDAVDEESVERVRERIAELMERPTEQWYEHASLEAAGTLKEQTAAGLREMSENLAKAEQAAAKLAEMTEALPQELQEALANDLKLAALALQMGAFKPPADLAQMLRDFRGADLRELTPGQCRGLCQQLRANQEALQRALAESPGLNPGLNVGGFALEGAGEGEGTEPGKGAINRGRGDAELTFGAEHDLKTTRKEKVNQALDPERAAPDELLAVIDGEHEIDEAAYTGPQAGGAAQAGDGGVGAQVDSLLPAEQAAVRRFFE